MEQTDFENTISDAPVNHDENETRSPFEQGIPAEGDRHVLDPSQVDVEDRLRSYHFENSAHLHDVVQHTQDQSSAGGHDSLEYPQPDYNAMAAALNASRPPSSATTAAAAAAAAAAATHRTKISKACDQCRQKKVRCDGVSDISTGSCTACKRAEIECTFKRQQMKRGPSRGYIKKLTETVERLERQRTGKHAEDLSLSSVTEEASLIPASAFSNFYNAENRQNGSGLSNDSNGYSQQKLKRSAEQDLDPTLREGVAPVARGSATVPWRPAHVNLYLQEIYPYLPFLHPEAPSLHQRQPPGVHLNALTACLEQCLMTLDPGRAAPADADEASAPLRTAHDTYTRTSHVDKMTWSIKAQSALALLITSIPQASAIDRDSPVAPSNLMQEVRTVIEDVRITDTFALDEPEGRRSILCAGLLDVLTGCAYSDHSVGLESLEEYLNACPEDLTRFGPRFFGLTRLASVLRKVKGLKLKYIFSDDNMVGAELVENALNPSNVSVLRIVKGFILHSLEEFQLTSGYQSDPILCTAFWYTRLIIELQIYPLVMLHDLLLGLNRIIEGLHSLPDLNILTHHFTGLATHLLIQLTSFEDTKHEAAALLDTLYNILSRWMSKDDGRATSSVDTMIFAAVHRNVNRERPAAYHEDSSHRYGTHAGHEAMHEPSTLEHLANAAVGSSVHDEHESEMTLDGIAEAAAAAAKAALSGHRNGHVHEQMEVDTQPALETFSGDKLSRDGYLTALMNME